MWKELVKLSYCNEPKDTGSLHSLGLGAVQELAAADRYVTQHIPVYSLTPCLQLLVSTN